MTKPLRHCPFCRTLSGCMLDDTPKQRLYECRNCFAVEVITKGNGSWWYHGWQRPDGLAINADGRRESLNSFGWWDRHA